MKERLRNEVDSKFKWNLDVMLDKSTEEIKSDILNLLDELLKFKGHICDSSDSLYNFYQVNDKLSREIEKLYCYSHMNYDSDTTNSKSQALFMEVEKLINDVSEKTTFITPEILKCDYEVIKKYIEEDSRLKEYSFDLEQLFRNKPYILSEKEEEIITLASNAMGTGDDVFNNIDNTDVNLGTIKDENGIDVELTHANYSKYMNSKDRRVRIDAFNSMYNYFKGLKNTIAACLKGNIKENFFSSKVRGFESPIKQSLFEDNIDISVYDNLIESVHNNLDTMYEYMAL